MLSGCAPTAVTAAEVPDLKPPRTITQIHEITNQLIRQKISTHPVASVMTEYLKLGPTHAADLFDIKLVKQIN